MRSAFVKMPKGWTGHCEPGHFVWRNGWVDVRKAAPLHARHGSGPMVIRDIEPYRNMIDGKIVGGRRQHRDLLRAHNCVEVGNETPRPRTPVKPDKAKIRESIKESVYRLSNDQSFREHQQNLSRREAAEYAASTNV